MVTHDELKRKAKELAVFEAESKGFDEYDTEDLIHEANFVVDEIFDSIYMQGKSDNVKDKEYLDNWIHRSKVHLNTDLQRLAIDRQRIQEAVKIYLDNEWMNHHKFDWLIVNLLNYAEYLGAVDSFLGMRLSMGEYMEKKFAYLPEYKHSSKTRILKKGLLFIILWGIWVFLLLLLNDGSYKMPIQSYVFIIATIIYQVVKFLNRKKINAKIHEVTNELYSTYECCSNLNISWGLIWDSMIKSKDKDVVWDNLVYALVEQRMKN